MTDPITRRWLLAATASTVVGAAAAAGPATRPATGPASRPVPVRIVAWRRPDEGDSAEAAFDGRAVALTVTSPTGINGVTLERVGPTWGSTIVLRLQYAADRPFKMLEGGSCTLLADPAAGAGGPAGTDVGVSPARPATNRAANEAPVPPVEYPLPDGADRHARLRIEWVDAYRR